MNAVSLHNGNEVVVERVWVADRWWSRMRGLLGRDAPTVGEGMWLLPGDSIHTWGMRFAIDCLFLDREMRVVRLVRNVKPWRLVFGGKGAYSVVELASGWLAESSVSVGDQLTVV